MKNYINRSINNRYLQMDYARTLQTNKIRNFLSRFRSSINNFVLYIALLGIFFSHAAQALVDPNEPFDARRIPVELQAWWTPNFGHVHAGLRLPLGQVVSGKLDVNVRVVLHDNPSKITWVRICAESSVCFYKKDLNLTCPYDGITSTNCAFNVPISMDTTKMKDGWRELRVSANMITADGKRFFNSSGIPINVQNGFSDSNYNRYCNNKSLIGRGWYEEFDYTNAVIECVPLAPISGTHVFRVRAQNLSEHLKVALDRNHHIPAVDQYHPAEDPREGIILFDKEGSFTTWQSISIDTLSLENGWHTLSVTSTSPRGSTSECDYCNGEFNKPHGVAKMWFYVQN